MLQTIARGVCALCTASIVPLPLRLSYPSDSLLLVQALQDRALLFLSAGLLKRHIPRSDLRPPREAPAATYNDPITFAPLPHVLREYIHHS
jgi:hypothetical protein